MNHSRISWEAKEGHSTSPFVAAKVWTCSTPIQLWQELNWWNNPRILTIATCREDEPEREGHVQGLIPGSERYAGEEIVDYPLQCSWASLVAQLVKNPPAMQETWVRSLGWEDPLEKGKYSGLENSMDYRVHGVTRSRIWLSDFHIYIYIYIDRYIYISKVIQDTGARGKQLTRTQDTHSSPLSTALSLFIAILP